MKLRVPPHLGVPAKGVSAEGSTVEGSTATGTTANGGDKIINTNSNPVINPYITPSFILSTTVNCEGRMEGKNSAVIIYPEDELSEEEIMAVWDEVESGIPAELAYDMPKMTKVIQCLADWNNRKTLTSDASMEKIYLQVVECLVEMVTDKNVQIYKNTKVTYKNVIDQINKECGQTIPGALQSFVIGMCNRIKIAFNTKTVKNPKAYIKSMIWEQFSVYGMIQVIDV